MIYKNEFAKKATAHVVERFMKYLIKYAMLIKRKDLEKKYKNFMEKIVFMEGSSIVCNQTQKLQILEWYNDLKKETPFGDLEKRIRPFIEN
jgi:hypothetical protein